MTRVSYMQRFDEIEHYFDRTAFDAWKRFSSDQPLSGIRETVRRGREEMRSTLAGWLPDDLTGWRILDAGCGSGVLSLELMNRGADVVGIDLSAQMISFAKKQASEALSHRDKKLPGSVSFQSGNMLDPHLGSFDAVLAMDVLIHYESHDTQNILEQIAARTRRSVLFTVAPTSYLLKTKLMVGKAFPRSNRAPAIYPASPGKLVQELIHRPHMFGWQQGRSHRVSVGFYTSQAMEIFRP